MAFMKKSRMITVALLTIGFMWGCGQDGSSDLKVTNGKDIEKSVYPAVILLLDSAKGAICTGTFIDDETVITAAHCTMGGEDVDPVTGRVDHTISLVEMIDPAEKKVKKIADSVAVYRNPEWDKAFEKRQVNKYDLGVIKFPKGTSQNYRKISSKQAAAKDEFTIVGFGLNYVPKDQNDMDPSSAGIKRMGKNKVESLSEGFIMFNGALKTTTADGTNVNASSGDSGGPMFIDGKLVGVTSGGGRDILGRGVSLYIDLHTDISKDFLASLNIRY